MRVSPVALLVTATRDPTTTTTDVSLAVSCCIMDSKPSKRTVKAPSPIWTESPSARLTWPVSDVSSESNMTLGETATNRSFSQNIVTSGCWIHWSLLLL